MATVTGDREEPKERRKRREQGANMRNQCRTIGKHFISRRTNMQFVNINKGSSETRLMSSCKRGRFLVKLSFCSEPLAKRMKLNQTDRPFCLVQFHISLHCPSAGKCNVLCATGSLQTTSLGRQLPKSMIVVVVRSLGGVC